MIENTPKYSVVVPVYNSQESLEELFERTKKTFDSINESFEVVFIEDCGEDNSWKVIQNIKQQNPDSITAIKLAKNFGQHNAILCGFKQAKGEFIITIDDDLQMPPEEISKLIQTQKKTESDVVYGVYKNKKHSVVRNLGSKFLKKASKFNVDAKGDGSSFRLIKKEITDQVCNHEEYFIFIDEMLNWYTNHIELVEVEHLERKHGTSGYSFFSLMKMMFSFLINYTLFPLRLMTFGGMFFSLIFFIIGSYFIYKKIAFDVQLGFTGLIVSIFFSSGIILLSLGIIGEYIGRLFSQNNKRPQYYIKTKL